MTMKGFQVTLATTCSDSRSLASHYSLASVSAPARASLHRGSMQSQASIGKRTMVFFPAFRGQNPQKRNIVVLLSISGLASVDASPSGYRMSEQKGIRRKPSKPNTLESNNSGAPSSLGEEETNTVMNRLWEGEMEQPQTIEQKEEKERNGNIDIEDIYILISLSSSMIKVVQVQWLWKSPQWQNAHSKQLLLR